MRALPRFPLAVLRGEKHFREHVKVVVTHTLEPRRLAVRVDRRLLEDAIGADPEFTPSIGLSMEGSAFRIDTEEPRAMPTIAMRGRRMPSLRVE